MDRTTKTISTTALAAILATVILLGGINITGKNVYYCKDRNLVMQCEKITKYYGLDNGKCINSKIGNKVCRTGWLKVTKDIQVNLSQTPPNKRYICSKTMCISK